MPFAQHSILKTSRAASTFLLSAAWIVLSLAAAGEMSRLASAAHADLVRELLAALLLFGGFYAVSRMWVTDLRPLSSVGFVLRPGIGGEFARGLALGWGIALALVLPALLTGNLSITFTLDAATTLRTVEGLATLLAFAFVVQLVLNGLPIRMLTKATTAGWATAAVVFVVCALAVTGSASQGRTLPVMVLAASLFVAAFLRTRGIWLALGLQLGWTVSLQLLFGASSPYTPAAYGPVQALITGPVWLTGSAFGPEASLTAVIVLVGALVVLFRLTKDYAWHYTWQPMEGAGHPMDVPPPAEHLRQEQRQAAPAPLIQIGGLQTGPATPASEHVE